MRYAEVDLDLLSNKVASLRYAKGWEQQEAAARMGVSPTWISHIERGARLPSLPNFVKICLCYEVSADELLGLTG